MRFAEAGHPVRVPGMSHQQLCRPEGQQGAESCGEPGQELEERHPAQQRCKDCCRCDRRQFQRDTSAHVAVFPQKY